MSRQLHQVTVLDVERARLLEEVLQRLGRPVPESVVQVARVPLPDEVLTGPAEADGRQP